MKRKYQEIQTKKVKRLLALPKNNFSFVLYCFYSLKIIAKKVSRPYHFPTELIHLIIEILYETIKRDRFLRRIDSSKSHNSAIITTKGIYVCGSNEEGQLGSSHNQDFTHFDKLPLKDVTYIAFGISYSLVLTSKGLVYGSGFNNSGQLGLKRLSQCNTYKQILINQTTRFVAIYCGFNHSFLLCQNGDIMGTGDNMYGQLGLGDSENRNIFEKVNALSNIVMIACGQRHTYALNRKGRLFYCGFADFGIGGGVSVEYFQKVPFEKRIISIACGSTHTLIQDCDSNVYSRGNNSNGQLGISCEEVPKYIREFRKIDIENIVSIGCGSNHSLLLNNQDELFVCGQNDRGQLGLGHFNSTSTFQKVQIFNLNQELVPLKVISFGAGVSHTIVLTRDNQLLSTGLNTYCQLGQRVYQDSISPLHQRHSFEKVPLQKLDVIKL